MPGQLISLFINKNYWTDNNCPQLLSLSKQTVCVCVCVVNFCKHCSCSHDQFAVDRWPLVWSSLALYGRLWPVLPGSGLLICWPTCPCRVDWLWPALYCIYLSLTWFLLEESLNVSLLCLTFSLFRFFFTQSSVPKNLNQYYTNSTFNSHIIIWLNYISITL